MIKLIRLTTGEEIAGEVRKTTKKTDTTTIHFPLKIVYRQSVDGMPVTFVARFSMFSKDAFIEINNSHIVCQSEARESFCIYYKDAVKHYESIDDTIDKQLNLLSNDETDVFDSILKNMPKGSSVN